MKSPLPLSWFLRLVGLVLFANLIFQSTAVPVFQVGGNLDSVASFEAKNAVRNPLVGTESALYSRDIPENTTIEVSKRASCFVTNFLCCFSCCQQDSTYVCTGEVPSLDELKEQISIDGLAKKYTSVFYTRLDGGNGISKAKCWFNEHPAEGVKSKRIVYFNNVVADKWFLAVANSLRDAGKPEKYQDRLAKLLSQAYAESVRGKVFVFMPSDLDSAGPSDDDKNTWRLWEYPALTRNPNVDSIVRVDPAVDDQPTEIWKRGDPPSPDEPLGTNWPGTLM